MITQTEIINLEDLVPTIHLYLIFTKLIDLDKIFNNLLIQGFFRQDDVCTEHYLCTNIASVAYCLFDGFVSVAISMAYGNI
jgi:hypothetical protein